MNLTWHLLKKDFHRLRLPLVLFSLLMIGKIVFYAVIAGLWAAPDIEWLRRTQQGPELMLRFLAEPIFTFVLVGWLVFEDSPIEQDAHWLTRPISGGQLFGVKLAVAGVCFVLWPLLLNVLWWLACGVGAGDIAISVRELVATNSVLVAAGLACAALTGGFPRYVLWGLVATVVFVIAQLGFSFLPGGPGAVPTRTVVCAASGSLAALVIAWHQFVTRRHRRSLALVGAGVVMVGLVCAGWRWNFPPAGGRQPAAETPASAAVTVQLAGPIQAHVKGAMHSVQLPLRIEGVPDRAAVGWMNVRGDWSFSGAKVWTSRGGATSQAAWEQAIRRQLGLPAPSESGGPAIVSLPLSSALAQRALRETASLHASIDLDLVPGEILAELQLHEGKPIERSGPYTISHLVHGPVPARRRGRPAAPEPPAPQNGVSLLLTERSAQGFRANSTGQTAASVHALVNRRTGEVFMADGTRSGPEAISVLNQAKAACMRLTFLMGDKPVPLDELSLVALRFSGGERLKRELKIEPVTLVADPAPRSEARPAPASARMAELVRAHAAGDKFMGSVLVAKGDAVVFAESTGWADMESKAANQADTRFRIGSLTKQFTAAAILLLEERGRLQVDDLLAKYVSEIPDSWRAVTLRHLLTHTSGISNFTNLPEYAAWEQTPLTPEELVRHLRDRTLDFNPGTDFNYSNTGYVLLGRVVEIASGRDYGDFLRDNIFLLLGMKDSGYERDDPPVPLHARGLVPGPAGPVPASYVNMRVPGGAGALYSTTADLLRWTQGLFGGRLLSPASLEKMITPARNGYAFGVGVSTIDGRKVIAHGGAIAGFVSQLSYFPEEKLTVAVLANIGGAPVNELARQLGEVAFGKTVTLQSERKEVAVPVATLQRNVGVYQLTPGVTNTVRLAEGRLTTRLSGQRAFPLFPESERRFFLKIVDAQVEFVTDDQGRVTHLLQFQGGRTQTAPRISDVVERKAVPVSPEILAAYVGSYELQPDFIITVTVEGARLMVAAPGQGKSPVLAETDTKFFSPESDAQIEFFRDSHGVVTHAVVHAGGPGKPARRKP